MLDSETLEAPVQVAIIGKQLKWPELGDQSLLKNLSAEQLEYKDFKLKSAYR